MKSVIVLPSFKKGDRVRIDIKNMYDNVLGEYLGPSRREPLLMVRRDGIKQHQLFHPVFIAPEKNP